MHLLDYLRNLEPPDAEQASKGEVQVEYRLLCSGACYPAHFLGDWSHSDVARILLRWPVCLLVASQPYENYPQELALRFSISPVETRKGRVRRGGLRDHEIASDLAAVLTLLSRRLITVSALVRRQHLTSGPPGPFPPAPTLLLDFPAPAITTAKKVYWSPRPLEVSYGLQGAQLKSYQPPIHPFDTTCIMNVLFRLPALEAAEAVIRAARLYARAMELIEEEPEISYQLLISAVETMAQEVDLKWTPTEEDRLELPSSKALIECARKEKLSKAKARRLALAASKDYGWLGRKFREFIRENVSQDVLTAEDDLFVVPQQLCPSRDDLENALVEIYGKRGKATHGGHAYPATARIGPSPLIPSELLDDILSGEKLFPPVAWFERVVQSAICGYLRSQVPPPAPARADMPTGSAPGPDPVPGPQESQPEPPPTGGE